VSAPRILIVRLSALGDAVHVLPALAALRAAFPDAHLGWVVEEAAAGLLRDHPQLDRVHVLPRKGWKGELKRGRALSVLGGVRRFMGEVRRERYDAALDFQSNFRSSLVTFLSGAPRRIGQPVRFSKEASRVFLTRTPRPVSRSRHKIDRNLALLECLGLRGVVAPTPLVAEPPGAAALGARFAGEAGPRVVLQAGVSAFGALKAWPEAHFGALARALVAAGVAVYFAYGGARELEQARRLAAAAPGAHLSPPTADLLELAALLRHADLFVGVDSGPLHLAGALGTPVLGLYGPKHPGTYGPYWPGGRVVRSGIECSPCWHRRCPRPDVTVEEQGLVGMRISPCMQRLEPSQAARVALDMLGVSVDT
jgi:lipopolysaccharide heptosyltransferase I